ncbi:uncharacterized protein LOC133184776 [Saccostrea echinata]|uniref:uncharacterized protein LOC133184776 n=1 Tax=Saccostrea echinata TaxID=191078 RepID=UPI002A80999B|nr:uncharacterized protein LOC133184776 [Saccostrea echinata]
MKCLMLLPFLVCCWTGSFGSLSIHSNNLVELFSDYLTDLENRQMNMAIHNRKRDVGSGKTEQLRICSGRKDCGSVVQNFGFLYDAESAIEICNSSFVTKADGVKCFDKYPSCGYLRDKFNVCKKKEVVDKLGCDLTCGKCKPEPKFGSQKS